MRADWSSWCLLGNSHRPLSFWPLAVVIKWDTETQTYRKQTQVSQAQPLVPLHGPRLTSCDAQNAQAYHTTKSRAAETHKNGEHGLTLRWTRRSRPGSNRGKRFTCVPLLLRTPLCKRPSSSRTFYGANGNAFQGMVAARGRIGSIGATDEFWRGGAEKAIFLMEMGVNLQRSIQPSRNEHIPSTKRQISNFLVLVMD